MIRRVLVFFVLFVAAAGTARAQIIGREQTRLSREPIGWVSLGIGWMQQQGFNDPETGDGWDFGSAPQWRGTLEFPVGRGATFGAVGTIARVPLIYDGATCSRCDADANISQLMALFRIGGGSGLHQVIDVEAGVTLFSNFRESDSGARLGTGKTSQTFSFGIGYGLGYALSPRTHVTLAQDYDLIILKRLPGTSRRTAQQSSTRIGLRLGLGDR